MSNLGFPERTLGSLNSWPQDFLRYLFLVTSTPYTTLELAAFFFENRIRLITALDFFRECCNPPPKALDFFRSKYDTWERSSNQKHMYEYYDMRIGQVVELSGSDYHDRCVVIERDIPISIGFGIFCPTRIMRHIDAMRASDRKHVCVCVLYIP